MGTLCLTRRKTQFQLLADACASTAQARIALRRSDLTDGGSESRLVELQPDGVLLRAPDDDAILQAPPGSQLTVVFEHLGQDYTFSTKTRGVGTPAPGSDSAGAPLLRLSLPLHLEQWRPRKHFRLSLDDREPVHARLIRIFGRRLSFELRLTNISAGGFAGEVDRETARQLDAGSPFWASFVLPGEHLPFESVVRLAHAAPSSQDDRVLVGWTLCGADCAALNDGSLPRLEQFAARCGKLRTGPDSVSVRREERAC